MWVLASLFEQKDPPGIQVSRTLAAQYEKHTTIGDPNVLNYHILIMRCLAKCLLYASGPVVVVHSSDELPRDFCLVTRITDANTSGHQDIVLYIDTVRVRIHRHKEGRLRVKIWKQGWKISHTVKLWASDFAEVYPIQWAQLHDLFNLDSYGIPLDWGKFYWIRMAL